MIAIIGAMKVEIDALLKRMSEVQACPVQKISFYTGKLAGDPVVVTQSGVGKTLAAMSTTLLLEHFDVDGVINIGTAGGLLENQEVLNVPGWNHGFGPDNPCCFSADERYIQAAGEVIQEQDRAWIGPVASGDCFVNTPEQVERILRDYPQALCAEMEAASIAQVCAHYGVPFVVVRSLSDITLKEGNEMTFEEYAQKASARSADWCEKLVVKLAERS